VSGPRRGPGEGEKRRPKPSVRPAPAAGDVPDPIPLERRIRVDRDPEAPRRRMERLADLLPETARQFGLEDQLEQARAAAAWLRIVAERVPAAAGSCRLTELSQGIATIETDEPIVAQEIRLRSPELLRILRGEVGASLRQIRITTRHV
jgi:predicted nucleic acid-binding Zn ribbon protein